MADPYLTYNSGVTGQTVRAMLCRGLTAFNPTTGAFEALTSGNWSSHLLTLTDAAGIGVYSVDCSTLSPVLPSGAVEATVYLGTSPGAPAPAGPSSLWWTGTAFAGSQFTANGNQLAVPATDGTPMVPIPPVNPNTLLFVIGGNGPYSLTHSGGTGAGGAAITLNGVAVAADAFRAVTPAGAPVNGAAVQLFASTDTNYTTTLAATLTGPDGRWMAPLKLASGSYTLLVSATGDQTDVVTGLLVP